MKTIVLISIHLAAPAMRPYLANKERLINAFGGGMAISYVFMHLLPEVAGAEEHLGTFTFLTVLIGYVVFYLINQLSKNKAKKKEQENQSYSVNLTGFWLYSFILVIGLPSDWSQSHVHIMLMTLAVALHIIHEDYELGSEHHRFFDKTGRYILATAPLAGLIARWFFLPESDLLVHLITSILAGSIIYSVARKDIPNTSIKTLIWFFTGIIFYTGLLLVIESV